ncbi:diguanylate cyclase domain-containing protein [Tsuneonella sp. HG249]
MAERITLDEQGLPLVARDAGWSAEVSRENLQTILDIEYRGIAANLLAWFLAGCAAMVLPNAAAFLLPLTGRLVAMFTARLAFARLRAKIAARADYKRELRWLMMALVVGGASCAPLLTPILIDPYLHPARMVVAGSVIVGVTIVFSLLAPTPRLAAAFIGGFLATFAAVMIPAQGLRGAVTTLALCALMLIVLIYGVAASLRHRHAAERVVDNRRLSEELADSLAHAEFLAMRDPLTGLLNRRAFFHRAGLVHEGGDRHVVTIDLDHFKAINDRYGHAVGDQVLVAVGHALRETIASLDRGAHYPSRIGGEEFAMVLEIASPVAARNIAEMVRHSIALVGREIDLPEMATSASIGICLWRPGESLDEVLSRADAALYQAKARGRDRVMAAAA